VSKPKKIIDNPTSAELLKQFEAFESLEEKIGKDTFNHPF